MKLSLLILWQLSLCLATSDVADLHPEPSPIYDALIDNGTFGYYPVRIYATEEDLESPHTNFLQWSPRCADGSYYFLSPRGWSLPMPGPMILDARGELVWTKHFDNDFGGQAYDFKMQQYMGDDYLTFWLGDDRVRGHGSGFYYMLNSSYDIVHRVGAANGLSADLHEFLITPDGTAIMTMYEIVQHDITDIPGYGLDSEDPEAPTYIWDCLFQEVDIETGSLVFEWRASDHVPINETYHAVRSSGSKDDPFDWYHINSIQKDHVGNYLISARYTHSIAYIDGASGEIIWTLGGRRNDFADLSDGNALNFAWQHDARFIPIDTFPNSYTASPSPRGSMTTLMTVFDNAAEDLNYDYGLDYARGLVLELIYPTPDEYRTITDNTNHAIKRLHGREAMLPIERLSERTENEDGNVNFDVEKLQAINGTSSDFTVRVIKSYDNPEGLRSSSQGSVQILQQGPEQDPKVLVGFGLNAIWTEFDADGTVLCNVHYGANTSWERGDIQSYRVYKFPWFGEPETEPKMEVSDDDAEVYASWNGATDVTDWILQCADTPSENEEDWADMIQVKKRGFETMIPMPDEVGTSRYLRIIALDRDGRRFDYGTSKFVDRGAIASFFPVIRDSFPYETGNLTPLKIFLVLICNVVVIYVLFEIYRRYLSWRTVRPSAGILRWRKGVAYHLLGKV